MSKLRLYNKNTPQYYLYKEMHIKQNIDILNNKIIKYSKLDNSKMYMYEALQLLDEFIDPSDPDLELPNSIHAYQTAERIRNIEPDNYEFQITGLIHDLGKVLFKFNEPSHFVVGDTYVLGCEIPKSVVYYDTFSKELREIKGNGMYKDNCGIENLKLSFGHDEYLYIVLTKNLEHKLSKKYLDIIRYHSFYPWHSNDEYKNFMKDDDYKILEDVKKFNQYDLYSKEDTEFILTNEIRNYYKKLLLEYFPNKLNW